jgi:hypothetical protein
MSRPRHAVAVVAGVLASLLHAPPSAAQAPRPPSLSGRITPIETPTSLDRGEVATAVLDVRNTGTDTWAAGGDVRLAYHWTRADGSVAVGGGRRTLLPVVVAPGGTARLCALVEAPDEPGALRLDWDLVKEGVAWFSHRDPDSLLRQDVAVRPTAAPAAPGRPLALAAWLAVSLAHLGVGVGWASWRRRADPGATIDARLFDAAVFIAGTLHGVLFLAASTTRLDRGRGVWWLALFDLLAAVVLWRTRAGRAGTTAAATAIRVAAPRPTALGRVQLGLQAAGALSLVTLAVSWMRVAARSLQVTGSDAAHYHVPNVVNFAIGASPFDAPPTAHAYPMGASLVGSWFVLPVGDPWLIDLAMLVFFALLAASVIRAFTLATGAPGLAWAPWLLLALMAAPLFQTASLFSADLPFAAAFAAAATQLVAWRTRDRIGVADVIPAGLAFGLLCGVKTTGTPLTGLLLGAAIGVWAMRRLRRRERAPARRSWLAFGGLVAAALVAWLAGGGAWLVRNEVRFGSPVAPSGLRVMGVTIFAGETLAESAHYYSVAGDVAATPGYPLGRKVGFFVRRWIGGVVQPAIALLGVLAVDLGVRRWRRLKGAADEAASGADDPRLALLVAGTIVTAVFLWLLYHAPWSSLDWTRGLSLRYALPVVVAIGFMAFLGLFPRSWPWYAEALPAAAGGIALAALACVLFLRARAAIPETSPDPVPGLDLVSCAIAAGLLAVAWLAARGRTAAWATATALLAAIGPAASRLAAADAALVAEAQRDESRLVRCLGTSPEVDENRHRAIHAAMVASERQRGLSCPSRRVFLDTPFDFPLELASLPYATLVFDARRAAAGASGALADVGGSPCDYLLVTRAELETERGSRLLHAVPPRGWTAVAERGGFVAFATEAPASASK